MRQTKHDWTEPRTYTNPEGKPIRITIYDRDDGREVCSINLSKYDDADTIADFTAEFALIAGVPGLAVALGNLADEAREVQRNITDQDTGNFYQFARCIEIARAALAAAGVAGGRS